MLFASSTFVVTQRFHGWLSTQNMTERPHPRMTEPSAVRIYDTIPTTLYESIPSGVLYNECFIGHRGDLRLNSISRIRCEGQDADAVHRSELSTRDTIPPYLGNPGLIKITGRTTDPRNGIVPQFRLRVHYSNVIIFECDITSAPYIITWRFG